MCLCCPDAARKFGVRSAMPGFIGRRLCPELVFVKPNFQKYTRAAAATRAIFAQYDPDFEAGSLDEAHLDVTDYCRSHETTGRIPVLCRTLCLPVLAVEGQKPCTSQLWLTYIMSPQAGHTFYVNHQGVSRACCLLSCCDETGT